MYTNKRIVKEMRASMEERKVPQEELGEETEREEYSFLQEVIKDEEGGRKRLKRGIFKATVYRFACSGRGLSRILMTIHQRLNFPRMKRRRKGMETPEERRMMARKKRRKSWMKTVTGVCCRT